MQNLSIGESGNRECENARMQYSITPVENLRILESPPFHPSPYLWIIISNFEGYNVLKTYLKASEIDATQVFESDCWNPELYDTLFSRVEIIRIVNTYL